MRPLAFACALAIALAAAQSASAHGFWLNATHYLIDRNAADHGAIASETLLYIGMGHLWPVEEPLKIADVAHYAVLGPGGETVLKPDAPGLLEVAFAPKVDGAHVAVARYRHHFLTGHRVDGKTKWAEEPKTGKEDIVFSAHYAPYAKALLQVGVPKPAQFTEPVGDALELVPVVNPYTAQAGPDATLGVRVLYRGVPLAGASVFARHGGHAPRSAFPVEARTNDEGVAEVPVAHAGVWLLKVEHSVAPGPERAELCNEDAYEASLTFELR